MEKIKKEKAVKPAVEKRSALPKLRDKVYELKLNQTPIVYILKSRGLLWFDETVGYERELKYCENQKTIFVDEMKGPQRLNHIIFRDGQLYVPKEKQTLQKFLEYHPDNGVKFAEFNPVQIAENDIDYLELEIEALNLAQKVEVDHAEAILRSEVGDKVSKMTSKELKRDILLFARSNPKLFLELVKD